MSTRSQEQQSDLDTQLDHLIGFIAEVSKHEYQCPIISLGKDSHGNEHEIMLNPDGTITDLYNERLVEPGTASHAYYSKYFFSELRGR
jgi:hypothetical protein